MSSRKPDPPDAMPVITMPTTFGPTALLTATLQWSASAHPASRVSGEMTATRSRQASVDQPRIIEHAHGACGTEPVWENNDVVHRRIAC
jgi:hypothetical protein